MPFLRTSPPRLAAAIIGLMATAGASTAFSQDLPEVRPRSEIFGESAFRSAAATPATYRDIANSPPAQPAVFSDAPSDAVPPAKFPFSVQEPDWRSADTITAPRKLTNERPVSTPALMPTPMVTPAGELVPVQSLQLPDLRLPTVDSAKAKLASPVHETTSLPVLTAPEEAELVDPPAYAPKPASKTDAAPASAENLEGMLHGMLWITATIGLGAVVSLWMFKLWLTRGGRTTLPAKSLKLVDTLRIGPRCGVYLVQAEAHRVLVGIEHGKTMCLMPLPEQFSESLDAAETDAAVHDKQSAGGFERVADVFSARRGDERAKGATS